MSSTTRGDRWPWHTAYSNVKASGLSLIWWPWWVVWVQVRNGQESGEVEGHMRLHEAAWRGMRTKKWTSQHSHGVNRHVKTLHSTHTNMWACECLNLGHIWLSSQARGSSLDFLFCSCAQLQPPSPFPFSLSPFHHCLLTLSHSLQLLIPDTVLDNTASNSPNPMLPDINLSASPLALPTCS